MRLMPKKKTIVKTFKSDRALRRGIEKMAKNNYAVASQSTAQDGRSKKSWLMMGLFNFLRKQKTKHIVTFELRI